MNQNPYAPPSAPYAPGSALALSPERTAEIKRQIRNNNLLSFALGVPGFALQAIGRGSQGLVGSLLALCGAALLVAGLVFYARLRGRSGWYAMLGLLSCVGMLILYFIPKFCLNCHAKASYSAKQCGSCGAPLGM